MVGDKVITDRAASILSFVDLLRPDHEQRECGKAILALTALRRMDCLLEPTKTAILERASSLQGKDENIDTILANEAGQKFFNTSPLDFRRILEDPDQIAVNLRAYIAGFSASAREVIEEFDFDVVITRLATTDLLYQLVSKFADLDLHQEAVSYTEFRFLYEELEQRLSEQAVDHAADEPSVVRATPRPFRQLLRGGAPVSAKARAGARAGRIGDPVVRAAVVDEAVQAPDKVAEATVEAPLGMYVYALPYFLNASGDPIAARINPILAQSLLKEGRADRDVIQRFRNQVRTNALPEAPALLRIYVTKGKDAPRQERRFYALLEAADHWRGAARAGDREWFLTSLRLLDTVAETTGLEVRRVLDPEITDRRNAPPFPLPYFVCRPGARYESEIESSSELPWHLPQQGRPIGGSIPEVLIESTIAERQSSLSRLSVFLGVTRPAGRPNPAAAEDD